MDDLRALIREVLTDELAALRRGEGATAAPQVREEVVELRSSADLNAFVRRIMALARDGRARAEIEAGRHLFRLGQGTGASAPSAAASAYEPRGVTASAAPSPVRFQRGLVTERDVAALPDGQRGIAVAKSVRFTPLARDELRRRGIRIEREKQ